MPTWPKPHKKGRKPGSSPNLSSVLSSLHWILASGLRRQPWPSFLSILISTGYQIMWNSLSVSTPGKECDVSFYFISLWWQMTLILSGNTSLLLREAPLVYNIVVDGSDGFALCWPLCASWMRWSPPSWIHFCVGIAIIPGLKERVSSPSCLPKDTVYCRRYFFLKS